MGIFDWFKPKKNGHDRRAPDRRPSLEEHVRVVTQALEDEAEQTITLWREKMSKREHSDVKEKAASDVRHANR